MKKLLSYLLILTMIISLIPSQVSAKSTAYVKLSKKSLTLQEGNTTSVKILKSKGVKVSSVKVKGYKKSLVKVTKIKNKLTLKGKKKGNTIAVITIKYRVGKKSYKKKTKLKIMVRKATSNTTESKEETTEPKQETTETTETKKPSPTDETDKNKEETKDPVKEDEVKKPEDGHTHVLMVVSAVQPTCKAEGNIEYYVCQECQKLYADKSCKQEITLEDTVLAKVDHTLKTDVSTTPATCTEDGEKVTVTTCSVCGVELSRKTEVITKLGHDWGDYVVDVNPTYSEVGKETRVCKRDGSHKESREIPVLNHQHSLNHVEAKPATCEEAGNKEYYICSICNHIFTDENASNETTLEKVSIPALNHVKGSPVRSDVVEATCTKAGSYVETVKCTVCNKVLSSEKVNIQPLEHTPGTPTRENVVNPTCTIKGSYDEVIKCKSCLKELSRVTKEIPATGHTAGTPVKENEVAATCTKGGSWDEVTYCTKCKTETNRVSKTSEALGHLYQGNYDYKNGTRIYYHHCNRKGCELYNTKENCDFVRTVTKEPTCVEGTATYKCKYCSNSYTESIDPVSEHKYGTDWMTSKNGFDLDWDQQCYCHKYCTVCGRASEETKLFGFDDKIDSIRDYKINKGEFDNISPLCGYCYSCDGTFAPVYIISIKDKDTNKQYALEVNYWVKDYIIVSMYPDDGEHAYSSRLAQKTYNFSDRDSFIKSMETKFKNDDYYQYNMGYGDNWSKLRSELGGQFSEALNDRDWYYYNGKSYISCQMFYMFMLDMGYDLGIRPGAFCWGCKKNNYAATVQIVD